MSAPSARARRPETCASSRLHAIVVYNDVATQDAIDESAALETAVVKEDLAMIELLPADLLTCATVQP